MTLVTFRTLQNTLSTPVCGLLHIHRIWRDFKYYFSKRTQIGTNFERKSSSAVQALNLEVEWNTHLGYFDLYEHRSFMFFSVGFMIFKKFKPEKTSHRVRYGTIRDVRFLKFTSRNSRRRGWRLLHAFNGPGTPARRRTAVCKP